MDLELPPSRFFKPKANYRYFNRVKRQQPLNLVGWLLFIDPHSPHHDPRNFPHRLDEFWPDLWLQSVSYVSEGFVHNTAAFVPFANGPANLIVVVDPVFRS